jgi:hypothetical protein
MGPRGGITAGQSDEPVEQRSGIWPAYRRAEQPRAPARVLRDGGLRERARRLDQFGLAGIVMPGRGGYVPAVHHDLVDRHVSGHPPGRFTPPALVMPAQAVSSRQALARWASRSGMRIRQPGPSRDPSADGAWLPAAWCLAAAAVKARHNPSR